MGETDLNFDGFGTGNMQMNSRGKLMPMNNKETGFVRKNRPQTTHPNQKPPNNFRVQSGKQEPTKHNRRPLSTNVKIASTNQQTHGQSKNDVQDDMIDFFNATGNDNGIAADTMERYANILSKVEENEKADGVHDNSEEQPSQDKSSHSKVNHSEHQRFLDQLKQTL